MATATYQYQVGWEPVAANAFTFGVSTLDGGDVLSSQFYTSFAGTYDDITGDVTGFTCRRGRDDYLAQMGMGECAITLTDKSGKYNPKNGGSVLSGKLLPMRPVRVRATFNGTTYGLFRGFIRTIEHDPVEFTSTILCADLFMWLSRVNPVVASTSTTTGGAIGLILDAVGFTEAALRDLGTGDAVTFSADGSLSALQLITNLLEAERGAFYVSAGGVATYRDRAAIQATTTVSGTLSAVVGAIPSVDLDRIGNRASVTRTGGTEQTAYDQDSQATYGWADITAIDTAYVASDAAAARLAAYLVAQRSTVTPPMRGVTLKNDSTGNLTQILARDVLERVTVSDASATSSSTDFLVQGVMHTVEAGGLWHTWSVALEERVTDFFQFGVSTLDGPDVLGF